MRLKDIIEFLEETVDGKTLFTKELIYKLENGALQGVYSDQISLQRIDSPDLFPPFLSMEK